MGRPKKIKPVEALPVASSGCIIPDAVIEAAKKVGFTTEQIAGYTNVNALKDIIYIVDPTARNRLEPPAIKSVCIGPPKPVAADKVETFTVSIDARWIVSANHAACEEMQIQSQLRGRKIRNIRSLSIVRSTVADKSGKLVSQVTVNYKE